MKWRVVKPCVEQETGNTHEIGEIIELRGAFDISMLTATGCIVPHVDDKRETQSVVPMEHRKWGRKGK
jgi:hypothetical protein